MFAAFHNQSPLITMVCFSTLFISLEIAYFADFFRFLAKKKKKGWIQARKEGGATGALTSLTGPRGPPFCWSTI